MEQVRETAAGEPIAKAGVLHVGANHAARAAASATAWEPKSLDKSTTHENRGGNYK